MSSIDFDEVLVHVGEKGKYQNIMYYLLCISATLPAAFLAFSQVSRGIDRSVSFCRSLSFRIFKNRVSSDTGVRERVSGALVQNSRVGESDGSDDVGGEKGALATVRREVRWQSEEVLQVQNVRRKLHGDSGIVVGARGPRERDEGRGRGAGEVEDWVATATGR